MTDTDTVASSDEPKFKTDVPANGQLATPGLSPISEHVQDYSQPFPDFLQSELNKIPEGIDVTKDDVKRPDDSNIESRRRAGSGARTRRSSTLTNSDSARALKLSPTKIAELTSSPGSLPLRAATPQDEDIPVLPGGPLPANAAEGPLLQTETQNQYSASSSGAPSLPAIPSISTTPGANSSSRPGKSRSTSSPIFTRKQSSSKVSRSSKPHPAPLKIDDSMSSNQNGSLKSNPIPGSEPSPMPTYIPVPPLSLPTYLQLELASDGPSALYIHRSSNADFPYESSKVKFERLLNFLLLPPELEQVLWFGTLACLDSWLYTFTILPLRFLKAVVVLLQWLVRSAIKEIRDMSSFVYSGSARVWRRRAQSVAPASRNGSLSEGPSTAEASSVEGPPERERRPNGHVRHDVSMVDRERRSTGFRHRRSHSQPSTLLPNHKADMLQGLLIILSCWILMYFDASRMYHSIRGQAAIKLYVIYNVLEVFDRLFSALGQDVLECLFSKETLERKPNGRSKIFRPIWMFLLALIYNVIHATALFYQVVTLNVAVNSYSNALLTLLMSNQFVEIKGTVFKKFEKENLFQLTCADIVERFQLWLMLLIIALRNIVEVGGLTISLSSMFAAPAFTNSTTTTTPPLKAALIPKAFTLLPQWTGEVLGPFLIVLGSEMLVDWLKHAYINKFNNIKPNIYGRFLDVLAKDYYSHAFADQNLTKRLGLPVIPLSCLFIRASMQTYHMFLAAHMPPPIPSAATSVSLDSDAAATSPATTAALQHIDYIFRRALGRSTFGAGHDDGGSLGFSYASLDDFIALVTMAIFFLAIYLVLLACKLVLGMVLLNFARSRYRGMKAREMESVDARGKRVGGWGVVEVGEEKRRWIYEDDEKGLDNLREREGRARVKAEREGAGRLEGVERYSMAAKRIW